MPLPKNNKWTKPFDIKKITLAKAELHSGAIKKIRKGVKVTIYSISQENFLFPAHMFSVNSTLCSPLVSYGFYLCE